ncbi:MAG: transporter [Pyrinomonadaceae bacterium MAG19_C2-C3]|nr:transporter [Pyrinomonadaceae bacterium MAG19_C2-C3]
MNRRCRLLFAALVLLCVAPRLVPAQQPFITDDADVTPRGKFHFEFSDEYDLLQRDAFPARRQNTASFELGYGLLNGVEISLEAPLVSIFNAPGTTPRRVTGIGDTNFAVKYNFRSEREGSRLPALTVSGNIEIPSGDVARSLGSGIADYSINGIAQKTLTKRTTWRGNAGVIFSGNTATGAVGIRARGTVFTGATSLVRRFNSRLQLGAELAGAATRNRDLGQEQLIFQVGGNYLVRENLTFDFGVLAGGFVASPRAGAQIGVSVDF